MHTKNYRIETTAGKPVFTDGRRLMLTPTANAKPATGAAGDYSDSLLEQCGKRLGATLRLVPAGTVEVIRL